MSTENLEATQSQIKQTAYEVEFFIIKTGSIYYATGKAFIVIYHSIEQGEVRQLLSNRIAEDFKNSSASNVTIMNYKAHDLK